VVTVTAATGQAPAGLADSKLLSAAAREALCPALRGWAHGWSLGWASPAEIDQVGLTQALGLAGRRALGELKEEPDGIVLDGKHDWLTRPATLFASGPPDPWSVRLAVKGDRRHASVAAASVLAKVARDELMVELAVDCPGYGWESNKGYCSTGHMTAMRQLGMSQHHRRSWALPGGQGAAGVRG
jgi:ribonuclease HII